MAISPPHNWLQRDPVSRRHMIHTTPHSRGLNWETVLKLKHLPKHLRAMSSCVLILNFGLFISLSFVIECKIDVQYFLFLEPYCSYYLLKVNFQFLTCNISSLGGRFKKEIVVDGQSYLLLIRDEGGPPELQVGVQSLQTASLLWGCNAYRTETVCKLSCRHELFETDHEFPAGLLGEVWQHPGVVIQKEASSHHKQNHLVAKWTKLNQPMSSWNINKKKKNLVSFSNRLSNFCLQILLSATDAQSKCYSYTFKYRCLAFLLSTSWFEDM